MIKKSLYETPRFLVKGLKQRCSLCVASRLYSNWDESVGTAEDDEILDGGNGSW